MNTDPKTAAPEEQDVKPLFYTLHSKKFTIMSFFTLGLYQIFWAFKHWLYLQEVEKRKISPGWRAWFSMFFNYALFKEIRAIGERNGAVQKLHIRVLFGIWLGLTLAVKYTDLGFLLGLFTVGPLLVVQTYINRLNVQLDPECELDSRLTKGNWVCICVGGSIILLNLVALFAPNWLKSLVS
jgi:hypothetical protein